MSGGVGGAAGKPASLFRFGAKGYWYILAISESGIALILPA
jgi:hypothetical protein